MGTWWQSRFISVGLALAGALGCSRENSSPAEKIAKSVAPLSSTTIRTYGFESLSDWSPYASTPTLSLSSTRVQGSWSLSVAGGGWSSIQSRILVKEDPAPTTVGFDLRIPSPQPNPTWFGTVQLFVTIPSQNINNLPLGIHDLITWTPGQFKRAEFALPANVQAALNTNFNDLRWRIELNRPSNATAGYLFDRFTYGPLCTPQSDNNACTTDTCDANGNQVHTPVAAGTSCSDNNTCNGAETCNAAGTCIAGTPPNLNDNNPCTTDACTPAGGITHTPVAGGTSCADSNACNGAEACNATGTCVAGTPVTCSASDQCHDPGTCNPSTGACSNPAKTNGSACKDGNACTTGDRCQAGACTPGALVPVDDGNPCTIDSCDSATGVKHVLAAVGTSCSDGNACNGAETCSRYGTCVSGHPPGLSDGNSCTKDLCDPMVGVVHSPLPAGTSCSNDKVCDGLETCDGRGLCVAGSPPELDDGNPCTKDFCDPYKGVKHSPKAAGTACPDGNVCNGDEVCNGYGTCLSGTPPASCTRNICQNHALKLVDVRADFRDIWAGRESELTGKLTEQFPKVVLEFSEPVEPNRVAARVVGRTEGNSEQPRDCHFSSFLALHTSLLEPVEEQGTAANAVVTLVPDSQLRAGCEYSLLVDPFPANERGSCLSQGIEVTFNVVDDGRSAFDREVGYRRFRPGMQAPVAFEARSGINTLASEVFERYAPEIGMRGGVDAFVSSGTSAPSPIGQGLDSTFFRQEYRGVPVDGYGYLVQHENGVFRSAMGRFLGEIDAVTTPSVSAAQAIALAIQHVNPATRPWQASPPTADPPAAALLLADYSRAGLGQRLVWRVHFSGIPESRAVDIDAQSSAIRDDYPAEVAAFECAGFNPATASLVAHDFIDVTVPFTDTISEERDNLEVGRWTQGTSTFQAFNNRSPFVYRTMYVDASLPGTPATEFVCVTDDPVSEQVAGVHWLLQASARTFGHFNFAGTPWSGFKGADTGDDLLGVLVKPPTIETRPIVTAFSPPELIRIRTDDLSGAAVAHEFAHGVNFHARALNQLDTLDNTREAGALGEGYADIMAALTLANEGTPPGVSPTCMTSGGTCMRNIVSPKLSVPPHPDTYQGQFWSFETSDCADDKCGVHQNSTVASHWAYSLVVGRNGSEINDLGCGDTVHPLATDGVEAARRVGQLVFSTFSMLPVNADFMTAREFSTTTAGVLFDPAAEVETERAWHASGVGGAARPPSIFPDDGATDVDPWNASLTWEVGDQTGPWAVRYSTHRDLSDATVKNATESVNANGRRFARVTLDDLAPGTRYFWQGSEGQGGERCGAFSSSFTTSEKSIHLIYPARRERSGYYQTNPQGIIQWEDVFESTSYQVALSPEDVGCTDAPWVDFPKNPLSPTPEVYLGDTVDSNILLARNPFKLLPNVVFDEDHTYHLYIRAMRDRLEGSCAHFKVRKPKLLPFQRKSPVDFDTVLFDSGGPFVWTPSEGAVRYDVRVYQLSDDPDDLFPEVLHEHINAEDVTLDADGKNVEYFLDDTSITRLPRHMFWTVSARNATGFSRFATGEHPESVGDDSDFWNGAQEIVEGTAKVRDVPVTFDDPVPSDGDVPGSTNVTVVVPDKEEKVIAPCFKVGGNTFGVLWALVEAGAPVEESDIHDTEIDPNSTEEFAFCTDPLTLTSDNMVLAVRPYSGKLFADPNPPVGFGPQRNFFLNVQTCGAEGGACCPDNAQCHSSYLECDGGLCVRCGDPGEKCCDDGCRFTDHGSDHDQFCDFRHLTPEGEATCSPCGQELQPCCRNSQVLDWCDATRHGLDSTICAPGDGPTGDSPTNGICLHCGALNEVCCPGETCHGGLQCVDFECVGASAPTSAVPCNDFVEAGGNEGGEFLVDVGRNNGRFMFEFDNFEVPDQITLSNPETGEVLADTGCTGTKQFLEEQCLLGNNLILWCCGEDTSIDPPPSGVCSFILPFQQNSSLIKVTVNALCGDGTQTDWKIKLHCATE